MTVRTSIIRRAAAHFIPLALALCVGAARAETVQIANAADWAAFATRVASGQTDVNAVMTADVTLTPASPRVGSEDKPYQGDFNGGGHELVVNWTFSGKQYAAPFAVIGGCIIHDLHVRGSIISDAKFAGGLVGWVRLETSKIERCRVSVKLVLTVNGDATAGGFVGILYDNANARVTLRDCLFDGSLLGPTANSCGGFTGWKPYAPYAYYYNCLFAPKEVTVSPDSTFTFSRGPGTSPYEALSACYYTQSIGKTQGTNASAMAPAALAAALGSNWTVAPDGSVALALFQDLAHSIAGFAYQGVLRDAQGLALSQKSHTVEFRLYDQPAGGEALWGRAYPVLLDDAGLFNVALSDAGGTALSDGSPTNGLANALAANVGSSLYLGLTVAGSEAEISPRQKLLAVPVATMALDAASASGDLAAAGEVRAGTAKSMGGVSASAALATQDATVGGNLAIGGALSGLGMFPVGGIVLWSGSANTVPDGWRLCDGTGGTPNLSGRFVVGYDANDGDHNAVGRTGGEKRHTLQIGEMPNHSHNITMWGGDIADDWKKQNNLYLTYDKWSDQHNSRDFSSTGGNQPHENRPPYYVLCYIMRVK
jgi:microcystin-dependent protein